MTNIDDTLKDRGNKYGTFQGNATISQELKAIWKASPAFPKANAIEREGMEMILHKISRICNGDPHYDDSWIDIAGYAQLVVKYINSYKDTPSTHIATGLQGLMTEKEKERAEVFEKIGREYKEKQKEQERREHDEILRRMDELHARQKAKEQGWKPPVGLIGDLLHEQDRRDMEERNLRRHIEANIKLAAKEFQRQQLCPPTVVGNPPPNVDWQVRPENMTYSTTNVDDEIAQKMQEYKPLSIYRDERK